MSNNQSLFTMTLAEKIKSNPYLNVSNCTDIADIDAAIDELVKLDAVYGAENRTLLKLWVKFLDKKKMMQDMASITKVDPSRYLHFVIDQEDNQILTIYSWTNRVNNDCDFMKNYKKATYKIWDRVTNEVTIM